MLVWGLDAMVITFVAPHSLHAARSSSPRDSDLVVTNLTPDVEARVLVDGHRGGCSAPASRGRCVLAKRSLLATLPESTFFRRYANVFSTIRRRPFGPLSADGRVRTIGRVLRRLRIENLVLIREAELELGRRA